MIGMSEQFIPYAEERGLDVFCPDFVQVMEENDLERLLPDYDGWVIGDCPATKRVMHAGSNGKLKAAVRWGIGVDNVDFDACAELGIGIVNTPNMFGAEVADVALGYVIALARHTIEIDRGVRAGRWPKPIGISLKGKTVGLVGFGDIGRNSAQRFKACGMSVIVYDPGTRVEIPSECQHSAWPERLQECDFLVLTCSLNEKNRHMLNTETLSMCKDGVRITNVARGPLVDEGALVNALNTGKVHSAALDVFEVEPLKEQSKLRDFQQVYFGSHNGSNTRDAVQKTNIRAIDELVRLMDEHDSGRSSR